MATKQNKKRKTPAVQRVNIRKLRVQQAQDQERSENRSRRSLPWWARILVGATVLLALSFVLFRVNQFEVTGNVRYTPEEVADASGITQGDALLGLNKTRAAGRIMVMLPYVQELTLSRVLPGTIRIELSECKAMVAAESEYGTKWLMNDEGKLLEQVEDVDGLPVIHGVALALPTAGDPAAFQDSARGSRAMEAALAVETAGLLSEIRLIDVSDPLDIVISYEDRIEVHLGDGTDIDYRLQYLIGAVGELESTAKGVLDLSFADGKQAVFHPVADRKQQESRH